MRAGAGPGAMVIAGRSWQWGLGVQLEMLQRRTPALLSVSPAASATKNVCMLKHMGWTGVIVTLALVMSAAVYVVMCAISIAAMARTMQGAGFQSSSQMSFADCLQATFVLFRHGRFWVPFVQQVPLV